MSRSSGRIGPTASRLVIINQSLIFSSFVCHSKAVSVMFLSWGRHDLGSSKFPYSRSWKGMIFSALIFVAHRPVMFSLCFALRKVHSLGLHSHSAFCGHIFVHFISKNYDRFFKSFVSASYTSVLCLSYSFQAIAFCMDTCITICSTCNQLYICEHGTNGTKFSFRITVSRNALFKLFKFSRSVVY